MKLATFALILVSVISETNLRHRKLTHDSESRAICLDTCKHGNVGEPVNEKNMNSVCRDAEEKFEKNWNECVNELSEAFAHGADAATDLFCEFVCPYHHGETHETTSAGV
mmetsp:Transcript_11609/g.17045  ORF Transcript_11609/g.17045 Transcript_11609/m.17045 type:complete len:110 (+) Transcript_11609:362-691(+)